MDQHTGCSCDTACEKMCAGSFVLDLRASNVAPTMHLECFHFHGIDRGTPRGAFLQETCRFFRLVVVILQKRLLIGLRFFGSVSRDVMSRLQVCLCVCV